MNLYIVYVTIPYTITTIPIFCLNNSESVDFHDFNDTFPRFSNSIESFSLVTSLIDAVFVKTVSLRFFVRNILFDSAFVCDATFFGVFNN